jgi:hypothetical protein
MLLLTICHYDEYLTLYILDGGTRPRFGKCFMTQPNKCLLRLFLHDDNMMSSSVPCESSPSTHRRLHSFSQNPFLCPASVSSKNSIPPRPAQLFHIHTISQRVPGISIHTKASRPAAGVVRYLSFRQLRVYLQDLDREPKNTPLRTKSDPNSIARRAWAAHAQQQVWFSLLDLLSSAYIYV